MNYTDTPENKQKLETIGADVVDDENTIAMILGENVDALVNRAFEASADELTGADGLRELDEHMNDIGEDIGEALAEVYDNQPGNYGHFIALDNDPPGSDGVELVYDGASYIDGDTRIGRNGSSAKLALAEYLDTECEMEPIEGLVDGLKDGYVERRNN